MKIRKYLECSPVFALNSAYEAVVPDFNKRLKQEGVNFLQGLVLTALFFEGEKAVTPSQLASLFRTTRGNISHIISHLEYKGWVKRALDSEDARRFQIFLKAEGRKKALSLIKIYDRLQTSFEKELGVAGCQKAAFQMQQIASFYREDKSVFSKL